MLTKNFFILFCILALAFGIFGCGENSDSEPAENGLALVVNEFEDKFDIGEKGVKAHMFVGAEDGFSLVVEGEEIELYKFDPASDIELAQENIESAKTTGTIFSFPAVYNENIDVALVSHDEHPQGDKIKEIFKEIK